MQTIKKRNERHIRVWKKILVFILISTWLFMGWPFRIKEVKALQYARPSLDVSAGGSSGWYESAGSTQTNIYTAIDEVTYSDTDYIYSSANQLSTSEIQLSSITDPETSSGHTIRVRALRTITNKNYTLTVNLMEGATQRATYSIVNPTTGFLEYSYPLSAAEADSITDYSNLRLQFNVTVAAGGGGIMQVSWASFEVPDAPAVTTYTQNDFRFYEDETTVSLTNLWGSVITGDNQDITVIPAANNPPGPGEKIRLQINLTVGSLDLPATTQAFKLQYKTGTDQDCSTGSWTDIGTKGSSATAWRLYDNTSLSDTATEANQISTSDVAGGYSELVTSGTNPNPVTIGQDVEWDWPIESVSGQVSNATTYSFRMVKSTGTAISYSPAGDCPTIETEPGTENLLRHGDLFVGGVEKGFFWAE